MPEFYHRLPCIIFRADFREAIDQIEALGAQLLADAVLLKNVQDAGIKEAIKAQNKVRNALDNRVSVCLSVCLPLCLFD